MNLRFEWDSHKAAANLKKHRVGFEEAQTVFIDERAFIFDDELHSDAERREIIIGHSIRNRLLLVCFTERDDAVRIISARRVTGNEQNDYEANTGG